MLELSKLPMYKFYYAFVKKNVKNVIIISLTQIVYALKLNFHEIMHEFKELFDLSNFPKNSKYFYNDNKKVPGTPKDEYGGTTIYKYIGLKSKIYSIRDIHNHEKSIYERHNSDIKYDGFKDTRSNKKVVRHDMRVIKSRDHIITT